MKKMIKEAVIGVEEEEGIEVEIVAQIVEVEAIEIEEDRFNIE